MIENLCDGSNRASWISIDGFLIDGEGWTQAIDSVHLRFFHLAEELTRVARQGLHETALTFLVNRIEGEGGLAATAQASDHHQLVSRDVDVDIFQVVLCSTLNPNQIHTTVYCDWAAVACSP